MPFCPRPRVRSAATLAALLLAACVAPGDKLRRAEVPQCQDKGAAECEAARAGFQRVSYATLAPDKLAVAAARALGDLNFEVERDDAQRQATGAYIDNAPLHDKALDKLFRSTLKPYQPGVISARLEVVPLPGQPSSGASGGDSAGDSGGEVHLILYAAPDSGGQPAPMDSVAPYQVFFSQLGEELGMPDPPSPAETSKERQKARPRAVSPSIGGL